MATERAKTSAGRANEKNDREPVIGGKRVRNDNVEYGKQDFIRKTENVRVWHPRIIEWQVAWAGNNIGILFHLDRLVVGNDIGNGGHVNNCRTVTEVGRLSRNCYPE